MVEPRGLYTLEMWQRLPSDGNRYELVDGELVVTPSPARVHQLLVYRLVARLGAYVDAHALGQVWPGPIDVFVGTHTVLEPDVAVELGPSARRLASWHELEGPALVVEVVSPGSARHDRGRKREVYLARGCEYWIVDPERRVIECWAPGADRPVIHSSILEWRPAPAVAALTLDVTALFADIR